MPSEHESSEQRIPYLFRLGTRLAGGIRRIPESRRDRHRRFILSRQQPDGGFGGREDESDLYYTGFAIRALSLLDGIEQQQIDSLSDYIRSHQYDSLNVIDLISWLYSALVVQTAGGPDLLGEAAEAFSEHVAVTLESTRTDDGGYARTTEGSAGSTYHSFMVTLTCQLLGRAQPKPNTLIQFLYDRQRDDGGFVEIAPMKRSGTNPTAAAVAMLNELGAMDDEVRSDVLGFLREVRSDEGGFQANTRIPFADGLSTFTAVLTAQDLDARDAYSRSKLEQFVEKQLEFPTGGFRGAGWDDQADVEYTFYGLGTLALLGEE